MSDGKDSLDLSGLGAAVPNAKELSAEDKANLVESIKNTLQGLAARHTDVLESLEPKVRKRVEVLREIQSQHDDLEAKFFEERAALEAKYQKMYEPLYSKRYEIVNGVVEMVSPKKLQMKPLQSRKIQERDEEALKYLKDIKWYRISEPKGFKLEFYFDTNPFFKNSVLTKTYHMIDEDEPILEKAIGTEIEWFPGKCLTQKVLKKKPKKGSKNTKPITKTENCESFFNFFSPPQVPDDDEEIDEDTAEQLQNQMEQDYDIGKADEFLQGKGSRESDLQNASNSKMLPT
uniref:Uncharacterized protein n=1 Tax=Oryza meridionalis TaxID=40149 RepID=A0A0E0DU93_9ORYZ